jgi:lipoprotein-releasing system permease protein
MFSPFERLVAMRYLRARRKEGFISVIAGFSFLGIMLGVATLIIVMAVMNGFRHEMLSQILGFNGHLTIESRKVSIPDFDVLTKALRGLSMVKSADPIIEGQVMVTNQGRASGIFVRGVRPEDIKARPAVADHMLAGSLDDFSGQDVVIIGSYLAQSLGIWVGGEITLISPQSTTTLVGQIPRIKSYQVVGIFKTGMYIYDSGYAFMPLEAAQLYFKLPQAASQIEVTLDDGDRVAAAREAIQARIGTGFVMTDWQAANSNYFSAIVVERNVSSASPGSSSWPT